MYDRGAAICAIGEFRMIDIVQTAQVDPRRPIESRADDAEKISRIRSAMKAWRTLGTTVRATCQQSRDEIAVRVLRKDQQVLRPEVARLGISVKIGHMDDVAKADLRQCGRLVVARSA